ncbi:MAG: hypothetical protein J6V82_00630, partial [Clostridia bacterium]|nr:hypothetical protein [Clostridia bacterium]
EKSLCFSERSQQMTVKVSSLQGKLVQMQDFSEYENALKTLDSRRKFYRMTGNRGAVPQTEERLFAAQTELERAKSASALYTEKQLQIAKLKEERPAIEKEYAACEKALESAQAHKADELLHRQWVSLKKQAQEKTEQLNEALSSPLPEMETLKKAQSACRFLIDHPTPAVTEIPQKKASKLPTIILLIIALGFAVGGIFMPWLFAFCALLALLAILAPWNKKPILDETINDPFLKQREAARTELDAFLEAFPLPHSLENLWDVMAHLQAFEGAYDRLQELKNAKEIVVSALQTFEQTHPSAFKETAFSTQDEEILRAEKARLQRILYSYSDELVSLERETALYKGQAERAVLLAQEIKDLKERLPRLQENLYAIEKAKEYLTEAKEQLSTQYLGRVQTLFADYVSTLSAIDRELAQNQYLLTADFEVQLLLEGASRTKESMSRGGKDLLALCLQLALSDALFDEDLPPLILDDPFIAFDDEKVQNALALLSSLSKKRQIVYFTCHKSRI